MVFMNDYLWFDYHLNIVVMGWYFTYLSPVLEHVSMYNVYVMFNFMCNLLSKVFDKDLLFDDFMGKVEFQVPRINETQRFVLPLMSRGCCVRPTQGEISLLVKCSSDMQSV